MMQLLETQKISTFKNTSHKQVKFMTPIIRTASSKYPIKFPGDSELPQCFPIRKSNNSQSIFTFFLWFFFHSFQPDLSHTFIPVCFSRFTPQCFQLSLLIVRKASSDLVFVSFWWHVPRHIQGRDRPCKQLVGFTKGTTSQDAFSSQQPKHRTKLFLIKPESTGLTSKV